MKRTTPEQRKKWLDWISTGTLNWHLSRISLDYLSPEGVIKALIADIEELEAMVARLNEGLIERDQRIEGLLAMLEARQITDKQIDRAWARRKMGPVHGPFLPADELGIVRCKECDGSGGILAHQKSAATTHPDGLPYLATCEACNGHGWVRRGDGDEQRSAL